MTTFILGGGCYWCLEAVYSQIKGVTEVVSGFSGGRQENPTYEEVSSGTTGHAEVVKLTFDESILPQNIVLDIYFASHDPTTLNRQGNDIGSQYRSIMFYSSERQLILFKRATERAKEIWGNGIVTEIQPLQNFYPGPDYHQQYAANNTDASYCQVVINPKLVKIKRAFSEWLKA